MPLNRSISEQYYSFMESGIIETPNILFYPQPASKIHWDSNIKSLIVIARHSPRRSPHLILEDEKMIMFKHVNGLT